MNLALKGLRDFRGTVSHPTRNIRLPDYMGEVWARFHGNPDHGGETAWYK
jgi:hypothetical protein